MNERQTPSHVGVQTLSSQVAGALIDMIAREGYGPGVLLPTERELCAKFGVSRTVIREATQVLAARGVLTIRRGTGVTVGSSSSKPVLDYLDLLLRQQGVTLTDLMELRRVLEVETAGLTAARATVEDQAALAQALKAMQEHPDTPEGYVDADVRFHDLIVRAAHNRLFETILEPVGSLLRASRLASFHDPASVMAVAAREHEDILSHILARDVEGARAAMRVHLDNISFESRVSGK